MNLVFLCLKTKDIRYHLNFFLSQMVHSHVHSKIPNREKKFIRFVFNRNLVPLVEKHVSHPLFALFTQIQRMCESNTEQPFLTLFLFQSERKTEIGFFYQQIGVLLIGNWKFCCESFLLSNRNEIDLKNNWTHRNNFSFESNTNE